MTHSDLCESSTRDVARLARWMRLEHERRESEPFPAYRRRLIVIVALATKRKMLVEIDVD